MKLSKFFMLALASILFVACDKDNSDLDSDNGPVLKGDAWVALSISTKSSGAQLRSLNTPNQDQGTAAESKINKVYAIFFDDTDPSQAEVTKAVELTPSQIGVTGSTGVAGTAFKVDAASKTVLLVANPPGSFGLPAAGVSYSAVNKAITISDSDILNGGEDVSPIDAGFMMTNAKGSLEPSDANGNTIALTLYSSELAAVGAPLQINIDRVVSKIRVYITEDTDADATISEGEWLQNVTNRKYFPTSVRTKTALEIKNGLTVTPYDKYGHGSYRIDPNYSTHVVASDYFTLDKFYTGLWNATTASIYCLENTQDEASNKQAYTTQVVVRAKYMPKKFVNANGTDEIVGASGDWMMIGGNYYSRTTLLSWCAKELQAKYSSSDVTAVSTPLTTALNNYIGVLNPPMVVIPNTPIAPGDIGTIILGPLADKLDDIESMTNRGQTVGNFTYYADAYSYYKVMIKHDNDDAPGFLNQLGEFGVVRNSVYDVNVTKFSKPGYPNIPTPGENDEDEDLDQWISVQININPWTWYSQDVEL